MLKFLLFLALPFSITSQISSTDGLIFYAPFSGDYSEASINNVNVSNIGASLTQDRFGTNNKSALFDGNSSYLMINQNSSLITTANFTISSWARMDGNGGGINSQNVIFEQRDDDATPFSKSAILFITRYANNQSYFGVRSSTGGSTVIAQADNAPTNNEWHHYVATKCDNSINLYIDGQLAATTPYYQTGNFTTSIDHVSIGAHHNTDNQTYGAFNGAIDEFRIYSKCLTSGQVNDLYLDNFLSFKELGDFEKIDVYPNPSNELFNIKLPEDSKAEIFEVYDVIGNLISVNKLNNNLKEVKIIINSEDGVYFVKVLNNLNDQIGIIKIIKK
jgi:hypothetical protein